MIFSALIDAGLIPFLAFTAIMAHSQYIEPSDTPGRWTSLFMFDTASTKVIHATYLVSVVSGSLHIVSLLIAVYLAVIFRKISNLPPDMNPLEENLTSRHKRNKSELPDSRISRSTNDTDTARDRTSRAEDPLISPFRTVPFMHTRNESSTNLKNVPYPHFSPRVSRANLEAPSFDQSVSMRSARTFNDHSGHQESSRTDTRLSKNGEEIPSSQTQIARSPTKSSSVYTDDVSRPASTRPSSNRPPSTRPRSAAPSLQDTNWITYPAPTPSPPLEFKHLRNNNSYQPVPQSSPYDEIENFVPRPLEMNPPTPPDMQRPPPTTERRITDQRALTPGTGNTLGMGFNYTKPLNFNPPQRRQQQYRDGYSDLGGMGNGKVRSDLGYGGQRGGRVVSRSGVEVRPNEWMGSGMRAREVSGKMAEEGRGSEHEGWGMVK